METNDVSAKSVLANNSLRAVAISNKLVAQESCAKRKRVKETLTLILYLVYSLI